MDENDILLLIQSFYYSEYSKSRVRPITYKFIYNLWELKIDFNLDCFQFIYDSNTNVYNVHDGDNYVSVDDVILNKYFDKTWYIETKYKFDILVENNSIEMLVERIKLKFLDSYQREYYYVYDFNSNTMDETCDLNKILFNIEYKLPFYIANDEYYIEISCNTINGVYTIYDPNQMKTAEDKENIELVRLLNLT